MDNADRFYSSRELFKQVQDYEKVIISVNSGSILVMIAFLEKLFSFPVCKVLVPVSFLCFACSLSAALLMMTFVTEYLGLIIEVDCLTRDISLKKLDSEETEKKRTGFDKKCEKLRRKLKIADPISSYSFLLGIAILAVFFVINYLRK